MTLFKANWDCGNLSVFQLTFRNVLFKCTLLMMYAKLYSASRPFTKEKDDFQLLEFLETVSSSNDKPKYKNKLYIINQSKSTLFHCQ